MKTHLFDVDKTIVRKTTAEYFIKVALKRKIIKFSQVSHLLVDLAKYKMATPDMDFIENAVLRLKGIDKSDLEEISGICFDKYIKRNIYKGMETLINEAIKKNEKVIFATSSFDFIIKPLENHFNITGSLATKMEYIDGKTSGKTDGFSFFGNKKKIGACEWMEKNNVKAKDASFYSDSYTDIPLLEYCGNPVAVNPDRILFKEAVKRGWKILEFREVLGATS
ncbi:MAG: HAD-IB family hydrolase [Treponema sp.]|nr:HAD-IB family hydrolase [Treponema sp.]MCL2236673.1 HAD-IB family hydrolase [Treponema sp.]